MSLFVISGSEAKEGLTMKWRGGRPQVEVLSLILLWVAEDCITQGWKCQYQEEHQWANYTEILISTEILVKMEETSETNVKT